jgi:hypothetical protein
MELVFVYMCIKSIVVQLVDENSFWGVDEEKFTVVTNPMHQFDVGHSTVCMKQIRITYDKEKLDRCSPLILIIDLLDYSSRSSMKTESPNLFYTLV